MARLTYMPQRGDLVHVNLAPSAGRELRALYAVSSDD